MESGVLTFIFVSSFAVCSAHTGITGWDDVVVTRQGMPTTLICNDTAVKGAVKVNWMVKPLGANDKLVLTASESEVFSGAAMKASMRLTDPNFRNTGVFSLFLLPQMEDSGLYSCLIQQQERRREKRILLAILTVNVAPAAPILQNSTLRLIANVEPDIAIRKIAWISPGGAFMKSEKKPNTGTVAKLPLVNTSDAGAYICMVWPWANNVASFTNVTHEEPMISTATKALTSFALTCPDVQGDYVRLSWKPPDSWRPSNLTQEYQYDRWRGLTTLFKKNKSIELAGPPYNAEAGSFSFLLKPELIDGGIYICDVFLNDSAFSRRTRLTVLKVKTSHFSSKLELRCLYTERSQVHSAKWRHQNKSRQLRLMSTRPGSITTIVPIPITSDTAGDYTCTLQLTNGKTVWATQAVALPQESGRDESVISPSLHPSLSALLLLVPLVAAAVGVLLWRQKHISDRSIEQSLSVHSSEAENIYEDPEDVRQAPPEGSVYMDLKPREEDDVYKELE